jgi:uncharacterized protein YrrD
VSISSPTEGYVNKHKSVLLCNVLSLLEDNVMVQMGEDEEMSYSLYFSNICL